MENTQDEKIDQNKNSKFVTSFNEKLAQVKLYIKAHPKQIFTGMIVLTVLSLLSNFFYYQYTIKTAKVTYKEMSAQIFDNAGKQKPKDNDQPKVKASITEQASDYFQMKKDLERLKSYQNKEVLSHEDSLDIKAIVNIYNLE